MGHHRQQNGMCACTYCRWIIGVYIKSGSSISPITSIPPPLSSPSRQCAKTLGAIPLLASCDRTEIDAWPNPISPSTALGVELNTPDWLKLHLCHRPFPQFNLCIKTS